MDNERQDLIDKANSLGIEFPSNVKTEKLKTLIFNKENPNTGENTQNTLKEPPATKSKKLPKGNSLRDRITRAKARALKLVVVTITNKDNRENDVMTTVPLSFENQYFGVSRNVPLDIPVQIEQALVDIAENTMMTLHKDEIVDGKRTGNKIPVTVKKFAVSYAKEQPE